MLAGLGQTGGWLALARPALVTRQGVHEHAGPKGVLQVKEGVIRAWRHVRPAPHTHSPSPYFPFEPG